MSKLIDIPEGTDIIDVKKKMNRLLSVARNESNQNLRLAFYVANQKQAFVILIQFHN